MISACRNRGWAYATPSYRLLPEATGLDILSDAVDAVRWVHDNISPHIIIAGSSAGGYLALAAATHPMCPRPLCVLSIYGMLDPSSQRYITPGQSLWAPVDNIAERVKEIDEAMILGKAIDGYPFPSDPSTDQRISWISTLHQAAIYPDVLTRIPNLACRIAMGGVGEIPDQYKPLFPVCFGLKHSLPPTVLLHGDADVLVGSDQSVAVADKLQGLGVEVHLELCEGQGHGFEAKSFIDLDSDRLYGEDLAVTQSLRRVISFLENAVSKNILSH